MSQSTDLVLSDQSGIDFRTELNSILAAIASTHKGSTAPSYAVAGMCWLDDSGTPWVLKFYDGSDWITMGNINATTNLFEVANAVLTSASNVFTGTTTTFKNNVLANTIKAETTSGLSMVAYGGATVFSMGAGGFGNMTLGVDVSGANVAKLTNMADPVADQDYATKNYVDNDAVTSGSFSSAATVNIPLSSDYRIHRLFISLDHDTSGAITQARLDGDSGASDYSWNNDGAGGATGVSATDAADAQIDIKDNTGVTTGSTFNYFVIDILNAADASANTVLLYYGFKGRAGTTIGNFVGGGKRNANAANSTLNIFASGGLVSGNWVMKGIV